MFKNLLFLLIILLLGGCSSPKKIIIPDSPAAAPLITGSVVNPSALEKGGTLVLSSFQPGTGAAADDDTDRMSLMMIKGIKDTLTEENTHFTIFTDEQKDSDFYLDGRIENYERKGNIAHLIIDGEIEFSETGEKVILFQTSAVIDLKTQNLKTVAYQIGVGIAHFIGRGSS